MGVGQQDVVSEGFDQCVGSACVKELVVTKATGQGVVVSTTIDDISELRANDRVVPAFAAERQFDSICHYFRSVDLVVAAASFDLKAVPIYGTISASQDDPIAAVARRFPMLDLDKLVLVVHPGYHIERIVIRVGGLNSDNIGGVVVE